jgi:hypothetical protein
MRYQRLISTDDCSSRTRWGDTVVLVTVTESKFHSRARIVFQIGCCEKFARPSARRRSHAGTRSRKARHADGSSDRSSTRGHLRRPVASGVIRTLWCWPRTASLKRKRPLPGRVWSCCCTNTPADARRVGGGACMLLILAAARRLPALDAARCALGTWNLGKPSVSSFVVALAVIGGGRIGQATARMPRAGRRHAGDDRFRRSSRATPPASTQWPPILRGLLSAMRILLSLHINASPANHQFLNACD